MLKTLESGHTVENVTGKEFELLKKNMYNTYGDGAIRVQPGGFFFPASYEKHANSIYNFKVKPTDVFVVTVPKSGTNWIQEIVWNLVHNPDLDNPEADIGIDTRCPFFENDFLMETPGAPPVAPKGDLVKKLNELCPEKHYSEQLFLNLASFSPDPRLLKTHLPCSLAPKNMLKFSKVIYLARDPRDCLVSYYHFSKLHMITGFKGTFEDMVENYINDRVYCGPYWEHVRQAWEKRNDPNFLFLFYEDLKTDVIAEIKKVDKFLGTNRTDKQIENISDYTSFESMKEKTKDNPPTSFDNKFFNKEEVEKGGSFFRKGKAGSWKDDFTPEIEEKVNAWMKKNLSKFGDDFKYKV